MHRLARARQPQREHVAFSFGPQPDRPTAQRSRLRPPHPVHASAARTPPRLLSQQPQRFQDGDGRHNPAHTNRSARSFRARRPAGPKPAGRDDAAYAARPDQPSTSRRSTVSPDQASEPTRPAPCDPAESHCPTPDAPCGDEPDADQPTHGSTYPHADDHAGSPRTAPPLNLPLSDPSRPPPTRTTNHQGWGQIRPSHRGQIRLTRPPNRP
jgi:hypothetical protein